MGRTNACSCIQHQHAIGCVDKGYSRREQHATHQRNRNRYTLRCVAYRNTPRADIRRIEAGGEQKGICGFYNWFPVVQSSNLCVERSLISTAPNGLFS